MVSGVLLSRQDYEARHAELTEQKREALLKIVQAKRDEIYARVRKIVTSDTFVVRPEDRAYYFEYHPDTSPALQPVTDFYLELGYLQSLIEETHNRFWPFEGNWKHVAESNHAAIPDTDTTNPELVAVSDTFNPQILENDRVRLESILRQLDEGIARLALTANENERLFWPLSGRVSGKIRYTSCFSLPQLLSKNLLVADGECVEDPLQSFRIERPHQLIERQVQIRCIELSEPGEKRYDVRVQDENTVHGCFIFDIHVPQELEPVWRSLFDKYLNKLLRKGETSEPQLHPLNQSVKGTMLLPAIQRGSNMIPIMREDAKVWAPMEGLLPDAFLRSRMLTETELERMRK